MASLNAFAKDAPIEFKSMPVPQAAPPMGLSNDTNADDDDLFALPLSPRSPDQGGGNTFTFTQADTAKYAQ